MNATINNIIQMNEGRSCSVKRKNFGKTNTHALLIFVALFCILGLYGLLSNWKAGASAVVTLCFAYLFIKILNLKLAYVSVLLLLLVTGLSVLLDAEWIYIAATSLFLAPAAFLKSLISDLRTNHDFEVFYLDKKLLKCLVMDSSQYKGYALHPKSYMKTYDVKKILSFGFRDERLYITVENLEKITPLELTSADVIKIQRFVQNNHPQLIEKEEIRKESEKLAKKLDSHRLLIMIPVAVFGLIIYFFADNGRNTTATYICIALAIITTMITFNFICKKVD